MAEQLALAEESEPQLRAQDTEALARLDREHANIVAALDTFEAARQSELSLRLAGSAFWYWAPKGHLAESRSRVSALLAADERPTTARTRALIAAADLSEDAADYVTAHCCAEEALAHPFRGDRWDRAYSLWLLAMATAGLEQFERAQRLFEECESMFRDLGDRERALWSRRHVAWMRFEQGDLAGASALHAEVAERARAASFEDLALSSLATKERSPTPGNGGES